MHATDSCNAVAFLQLAAQFTQPQVTEIFDKISCKPRTVLCMVVRALCHDPVSTPVVRV
jgi:hypothetical protein